MAKPQKALTRPSPTESDPTAGLAPAPLESVQAELGATPDGLSGSGAKARLGKYGYNELPEEKTNPLLKFLSYFWGPIAWMIETAAILSVLVRHWDDFGIISALLFMNAGVGFWEEFQAGNAIAARPSWLRMRASNAMLPGHHPCP